LAAEVFLSGFHRPVAGRYYHRAKLDAGTALLTKLGSYAEGIVHVAVLSTPDKAFRFGSPELVTSTDATST
jgi:hypothetical protein